MLTTWAGRRLSSQLADLQLDLIRVAWAWFSDLSTPIAAWFALVALAMVSAGGNRYAD